MTSGRSIVFGAAALLALASSTFTSGCNYLYAMRSDFEQCKARVSTIAIVPPVAYYTRTERPIASWKGWQLGSPDDIDPEMSETTAKNVEAVASQIISASRYKLVYAGWPSDEDSTCGLSLDRVRSQMVPTMEKIGRRARNDLRVSMGKECAVIGECTGATHLLFILAEGYSSKAHFDRNWKSDLVDELFLPNRQEVIDPETGKPMPESKIGLRVMLVEAATGSIVYCGLYKEEGSPGSDLGAIKDLLNGQLKPLLAAK